jgi:hypothetical protein
MTLILRIIGLSSRVHTFFLMKCSNSSCMKFNRSESFKTSHTLRVQKRKTMMFAKTFQQCQLSMSNYSLRDSSYNLVDLDLSCFKTCPNMKNHAFIINKVLLWLILTMLFLLIFTTRDELILFSFLILLNCIWA